MASKRQIEVFTADCPACEEAITLVRGAVCPSCEVSVQGMRQIDVARRAKALGVRLVPAVALDGKLAGCCAGRGIDEGTLRAAGLGRPLP